MRKIYKIIVFSFWSLIFVYIFLQILIFIFVFLELIFPGNEIDVMGFIKQITPQQQRILSYHSTDNNLTRLINQLEPFQKNIVSALQEDEEIKGFRKNIVIVGGEGYFDCAVADKKKCGDKNIFYRDITDNIPTGISIYRCGDAIILERNKDSIFGMKDYDYFVYINSKNLTLSGVLLHWKEGDWLAYKQFRNLGDRDICYPWNNLEDYWKIHGKASPEEIQKVIEAVAR